jgi:nitrite reductase/ring-hydroxylating ferredoxin subunit
MTEWIDVAAADAVAEGEVLSVSADGKPLALFRIEGQIFALYDLCSHGQARLSDGFVEDGNVECPLHQGLICIRTGAPRSAPVALPVARFETRVICDRVEVAL